MHLHRYDILLKLVRLFLFFHLFGFSSPLRPRWELMQYYLLELGRRWSRACRWTCYRCSCPCPIRWRPWSPTCCASGSRSPFRLWRRPVSVENLRDSRCETRRRSPEGSGSACVHRMLSKIEETKKETTRLYTKSANTGGQKRRDNHCRTIRLLLCTGWPSIRNDTTLILFPWSTHPLRRIIFLSSFRPSLGECRTLLFFSSGSSSLSRWRLESIGGSKRRWRHQEKRSAGAQ